MIRLRLDHFAQLLSGAVLFPTNGAGYSIDSNSTVSIAKKYQTKPVLI